MSDNLNKLTRALNTWTRWLRMQRALTWSLRGMILGLAASLAGGMIGLWLEKLLKNEFLYLLIAGTVVCTLFAGIIGYLRRIYALEAARTFDSTFHLGERVSTALELSQGLTHTSVELTQKQLSDAVNATRRVKPSRDFVLRIKKREVVSAVALIVLASLVWLRGEKLFIAAQQARNVQQAVQTQEAKIEEIIKQIDANPSLTEEQKKALTEPLNEALQELQNDPSLEGSVSTLTSSGEKLQAMTDQQAGQTSQALKQSGQALSDQKGSPLEGVGEKLAKGDTIGAASELQNLDLSKLNASQLNQLANQLETIADAVASTDPKLAEQLRQAARAARSGDTTAAQQALDQASQSMAQAGQQQIFNEAAGQAGAELQQGAGQVLAAGGAGQPSQTQGSSQSENPNNGSGSPLGGDAGSGKGEANGESSQSGESPSSQIPQNNGASDAGESAYEQIYAPSLLGGDNGENLTLPSSGQNGETVGTGPTSPSNDTGSMVPYTQVFSQYAQANQRAIDNGDVPFQFTTIIRNYFDSLKP